MLVVMQENASPEQIQRVMDRLIEDGFDVHRSTGIFIRCWAASAARPISIPPFSKSSKA